MDPKSTTEVRKITLLAFTRSEASVLAYLFIKHAFALSSASNP